MIVPLQNPRKNQIRLAVVKGLTKTYTLLLFLLTCTLLSCNKEEEIKVSWTFMYTGTTDDLSAVHFIDENNGHVVGGDIWFGGRYLQTKDAGAAWTNIEFADKHLFGLYFNQNNIGYTVGIDGWLYSANDENHESWVQHRPPKWEILRDVSFNSKNEGILVGGIAFAEGFLVRVDSMMAFPQLDTFQNELGAVCYSDDNTVHVGGYGIILRSTDGGRTWTESTTTGDYFKSISFPTTDIGFMVGANGSILKTTDQGINWKKLRDGNAITVSDQPFNAVHFLNENIGYIAGEDGLCWQTLDGGENWSSISGLPDRDFNDVFAIGDKVYLVGDGGTILRFTP